MHLHLSMPKVTSPRAHLFPRSHACLAVFGRNLVTAACAGAFGTTWCVQTIVQLCFSNRPNVDLHPHYSIFPIDMVKTRLIEQIGQANRLYSGPIDCARQIIARDGFKGLYRGLKVNFIGVMPEKAIKLAVNDACRNHFLHSNNGAPVSIAQGHIRIRITVRELASHLNRCA